MIRWLSMFLTSFLEIERYGLLRKSSRGNLELLEDVPVVNLNLVSNLPRELQKTVSNVGSWNRRTCGLRKWFVVFRDVVLGYGLGKLRCSTSHFIPGPYPQASASASSNDTHTHSTFSRRSDFVKHRQCDTY